MMATGGLFVEMKCRVFEAGTGISIDRGTTEIVAKRGLEIGK